MLKKIITVGLATAALALLALEWSSGVVHAQHTGSLFDFKPEEVVRLQIVETGKPAVLISRQSLTAPWQFNATPLSVEKAAEITATLKIIQSLSLTVQSEIKVITPTLEIQIATDDRTEYALRIGRRITDTKTFPIELIRKVAGATDSHGFIAPEQEIEKLQTQLAALFRSIQEPTRTPAPPTSTATPKPTPTHTATSSPTSTPSPTIPLTPAETPTPTPTSTLETANPIEETAGVTLAQSELIIAAAVSCPVILIILVALLILFWLRRKQGGTPNAAPFLELESTGLKIYLTQDAQTLGRGSDCTLRISENLPSADTVSRQHARLIKRDARWVVADGVTDDQPSTNGVYVNGKRTRENYLSEGDEIAFGELKFRFHIPTAGLPVSQGDAR